MKIQRMKKRPFLLAEILLAVFLIAVCALPLVKGPIVIYRKELENMEKIQKQRLATLAFFEIKKKLYEQQIPWKELTKEKAQTRHFIFEKEISLGSVREEKVKIYCRFYPVLPEKNPDESSHRLLEIPIYFDDAKQTDIKYLVYVKKS